MKKTNILLYGLSLILCTTIVTGCGNDERQQNEMQEERSEPALGAQEEARQTGPYTPGKQANEGDVQLEPEIGGYEMLPSQSIPQNAQSNPNLVTFLSVVKQAGMLNTLNGTGPYTVFAPSNEAFEALPEGTLEDLQKPANKKQLQTLLSNHIIAGELNAAALQDGSKVKSLADGELEVSKRQDVLTVNGAKVVNADIKSSNGVIHVIDKVLMPETE